MRWSRGSYGTKAKFMANKAPKSVGKGYLTTVLLFALVGGFFFANLAIVGVAHATETLYSQTFKNYSKDLGNWGYYYKQIFGTGLSGTLSQICLNAYSSSGQIVIRFNNLGIQEDRVIGVPTSYGADTCFDMGPTELNPATNYYLTIAYATYGDTIYFRTSSENKWSTTDDNLFYCPNINCSGPINQDIDLYFIFNGEPVNPNTLAISYPANATTTTDFQRFAVPYHIETVLPGPSIIYSVSMCYGLNEADVGNCATTATSTWPERGLSWAYNFKPTQSDGIEYVYKPDFLNASTTYYAKAYLFEDTPDNMWQNIIAESPEISFTIIPGIYNSNSPLYYTTSTLPTGENATSTYSAGCDDTSWYIYPLCWAFIPPPDVFNTWANLGPSIKMKPPVGYFYLISDQLSDISTSTPVFSLPIVPEFQTYFLDPFKTGATIVLYMGLLIYIFKRIKNLEL